MVNMTPNNEYNDAFVQETKRVVQICVERGKSQKGPNCFHRNEEFHLGLEPSSFKAKPKVVHIDKLKAYVGRPPKLWLPKERRQNERNSEVRAGEGEASSPDPNLETSVSAEVVDSYEGVDDEFFRSSLGEQLPDEVDSSLDRRSCVESRFSFDGQLSTKKQP